MAKPLSLSKFERLKSKKDIDTLFLHGKAFFVFPFKVMYQLVEPVSALYPIQLGVSVPKKIFKRAVDRNIMKRRMREIYRLNKIEINQFLISQKKAIHVMIVYTNKTMMSTSELTPYILDVLNKIEKRMTI